jgi:hypothetical protein
MMGRKSFVVLLIASMSFVHREREVDGNAGNAVMD